MNKNISISCNYLHIQVCYLQAEAQLKQAYVDRKVDSKFDNDLANESLRAIYLPYLLK